MLLHCTIIFLASALPRLSLRPRRHPVEEHFFERPHVIRQPCRHAGVHGRHIFAEPQPLVASGSSNRWRRLA